MWLAFYNPGTVGDALLLTRGKAAHVKTESQNQVTVIYDKETEEIVSINLFDVAETLSLTGNGPVELSDEQVKRVNALISEAGVDVEVTMDNRPKFVAGYVEECEDLEDSDHLSVTQTDVGGETVQIVCGANNIDEDMTVLVALPGAVMPSGAIIWAGELRGTESCGMICSTRELGLEQIEDMPGIWELEDDIEPGTPLDEVIAYYQGS